MDDAIMLCTRQELTTERQVLKSVTMVYEMHMILNRNPELVLVSHHRHFATSIHLHVHNQLSISVVICNNIHRNNYPVPAFLRRQQG